MAIGLTYGNVSVTGAEVAARPDGSIVVSAEAENTGVETDEVLQVYVEIRTVAEPENTRSFCGFLLNTI